MPLTDPPPANHEPAGNWRAASACLRADPDLFFPISPAGRGNAEVAQAKAFCAHCPVRRQCLEFALTHEPAYGIWGGTTLEERRRVRRREQRAARTRLRAAAAVGQPAVGSAVG